MVGVWGAIDIFKLFKGISCNFTDHQIAGLVLCVPIYSPNEVWEMSRCIIIMNWHGFRKDLPSFYPIIVVWYLRGRWLTPYSNFTYTFHWIHGTFPVFQFRSHQHFMSNVLMTFLCSQVPWNSMKFATFRKGSMEKHHAMGLLTSGTGVYKCIYIYHFGMEGSHGLATGQMSIMNDLLYILEREFCGEYGLVLWWPVAFHRSALPSAWNGRNLIQSSSCCLKVRSLKNTRD